MKLHFEIIGEPRPKQSARFYHTGKFIKSYQTQKVKNEESNVKMQVIAQLPAGFAVTQGAIRVTKLHYVFSPLKSMRKSVLKAIQAGELVYKATRPELQQALNAFSGLMGVIAPEVNVVKVDIKTKYDAIIGFNVGCVWLKPDYDIATKTSVIDITGNEAEINKLCDEAKAYINGKRSQLKFSFSGGAEDE